MSAPPTATTSTARLPATALDAAEVAVVGAGAVGAAIARDLAAHGVDTVWLDAAHDVGAGTTKANTAIWHTGFDAKPGTLEARLVARGYERLAAEAPALAVPVRADGAVLVAWDAEQAEALDGIIAQAAQNGYRACRRLNAAEVYAREPRLAAGAHGGILVPDEGLLCPFTLPLSLGRQALAGGVRLHLGAAVRDAREEAGPDGAPRHRLATTRGEVVARSVVNAAGLGAGALNGVLGLEPFTVTPRRGQLLVFDGLARPLVRHVILPVPTARTKGMLVAPTVHGKLLVGPTAEDLDDARATETTAEGHAALARWARGVVPALAHEEPIAAYAGLRAATDQRDYRVHADPARGVVCVGGIRSTGLSSCLGLSEHVLGLLADCGLATGERGELPPVALLGPRRPDGQPGAPPFLGEDRPRPCEDADAVAADPDRGRMVCHCERVSAAEVRDALADPLLPARDLDGLRRRTRAGLGRCQRFHCGARLDALLAGGPS